MNLMNLTRISCSVILIIALLSAVGYFVFVKGPKDEISNWKTFSHIKYGYTFKYPAEGDVNGVGMDVEASTTEEIAVAVSAELGNSGIFNVFRDTKEMPFTYSFDSTNLDIKQLAERSWQINSSDKNPNTPNKQVGHIIKTTVAGREAYQYLITDSFTRNEDGDGQSLDRAYKYIFTSDNAGNKFILSLPTQDALSEQILQTFKFINSIEEYFFKVYGSDKEAMNTEINFYIKIPENLAMIEKLKVVAYKLSSFKFGGLPIEVLKIKEQNGKKIAVVNLKESSHNKEYLRDWEEKWSIEREKNLLSKISGSTWCRGYFQGSTGGGFTTITLTKTFLQEDYKGEWIDGVEFYYDGKPMDVWEHIGLNGIIYREK